MSQGPSPAPFREEDLLARVEALREERYRLSRALAAARAAARARPPRPEWSWGVFVLGIACALALVFGGLCLFFR
jgi:hypothetical protein